MSLLLLLQPRRRRDRSPRARLAQRPDDPTDLIEILGIHGLVDYAHAASDDVAELNAELTMFTRPEAIAPLLDARSQLAQLSALASEARAR